MINKFRSGRLSHQHIGISSFTEDKLVLGVIGNANISNDLTVGGDLNAPSIIVSGSAPAQFDDVRARNLRISGIATFLNNVSIGGTLTYEDVTNIDSVGVITARSDVIVGRGLTVTGISTFNANIHLPDAVASNDYASIYLGVGNDVRFFHNGQNTFWQHKLGTPNNSGSLFIDAYGSGGTYLRTGDGSSGVENSIRLNNNSSVELYHSGTKKFETSSSGATVTGTLAATAVTGDGSGLTGIAVTEAPVVDYTVTANGSSAYRFHGGGVDETADDPDLYLIRGQKYRFNNTTGSSHPFAIREASGGSAYSNGVTGSQNGIQFFTVPYDAPAKIFYQCTIHSGMVGNIYIRGAGGDNTNVGVITATAFVPTTGQLSHRNLIMNGQFMIWQRATDSGSNTTDGYLSCDRWYHASSGATKQVTRQAFTPGQTDVPDNPKYYLRYAVTTGNNNVAIRHRIEDVTRVQGEMTFSFWVKGSNPGGGAFNLTFRQNFGTGGSPSSVVDQGISDYTVTNSWTKKTFTFTPNSISGKTIGTTEGTSYYEVELFRQPAGDTSTAAFTVDFANAQLERGPVATPFEQRSYREELANCQRYYYKLPTSSVSNSGPPAYVYHSGYKMMVVWFPTTMRATPTCTFTSSTDSSGWTQLNNSESHFKAYRSSAHSAGNSYYILTFESTAEL